MVQKLTALRILLLTFALLATAGCGKVHTVKGRVLQGGKNINLPEQEQVEVLFCRLDDKGDITGTFPAGALNDGTFFVNNLPEGKFRVAVKLLGPTRTDNLRDAFSETKSPFLCSVPRSEDLILDLPRTQRKP